MKGLVIALTIAILLTFSSISFAKPPKDIEPSEILTWEIINEQADSYGLVHFSLKNPDQKKPIKVVQVITVPVIANNELVFVIIQYSYRKNNVLYIFRLNQNNNFDQIEPPTL